MGNLAKFLIRFFKIQEHKLISARQLSGIPMQIIIKRNMEKKLTKNYTQDELHDIINGINLYQEWEKRYKTGEPFTDEEFDDFMKDEPLITNALNASKPLIDKILIKKTKEQENE